MNIPFTKMHGLGNDFVVFDFTESPRVIGAAQARHIADRHSGIGCDQILIVESSAQEDVDFRYRILNADGSEVGQCGNGARCFMKFVQDQGLSNKNPLSVETQSGVMILQRDEQSEMITVNMGVPNFEPTHIPMNEPQRQELYSVNKDGDAIQFAALSIGNPHAIIKIENASTAPVSLVGPMVENHPIFPERSNVGFMQIIKRDEIALRVHERGVGETQACGSGACAAVVAGIQSGELDSTVSVNLTGGELSIHWAGEGSAVFMTGPATTSFTGEVVL